MDHRVKGKNILRRCCFVQLFGKLLTEGSNLQQTNTVMCSLHNASTALRFAAGLSFPSENNEFLRDPSYDVIWYPSVCA